MKKIRFPYSPDGQGGRYSLAARITRTGSKQTYYTFLLLADRKRRQDAFQAYAYFRWLDDILDCGSGTVGEKTAIVNQQMEILEACYRGAVPTNVRQEEQMLVDLIRDDDGKDSGLQTYLRNMMMVMEFDVQRCGKYISQAELTHYTHLLSTAVTELLYFIIGNKGAPNGNEHRYDAVSGSHVVHMLRDLKEDIQTGYYNISSEYLHALQVSPEELNGIQLRKWVRERAILARQYFKHGRQYISRSKSIRCRLAGYAYIARFEWMLKLIERDGYLLKAEYPERKSLKAGLWMMGRVIASSFNLPRRNLDAGPHIPQVE